MSVTSTNIWRDWAELTESERAPRRAALIVSEARDDAWRGVDRSRDILDLLEHDPEEAFALAVEYVLIYGAERRAMQ